MPEPAPHRNVQPEKLKFPFIFAHCAEAVPPYPEAQLTMPSPPTVVPDIFAMEYPGGGGLEMA